MHGTASIFVRSANCSFSTDEWSFSHAYSTGRLSSSVSGRFTRWSVSFSTAGPIAQEKDVAAAISGFSSSTSMVRHSMPRAPLATASATTPTTPFSCATMSSSVMTYRPRPPHEHSPLICVVFGERGRNRSQRSVRGGSRRRHRAVASRRWNKTGKKVPAARASWHFRKSETALSAEIFARKPAVRRFERRSAEKDDDGDGRTEGTPRVFRSRGRGGSRPPARRGIVANARGFARFRGEPRPDRADAARRRGAGRV